MPRGLGHHVIIICNRKIPGRSPTAIGWRTWESCESSTFFSSDIYKHHGYESMSSEFLLEQPSGISSDANSNMELTSDQISPYSCVTVLK
jgi:hypothetical protein